MAEVLDIVGQGRPRSIQLGPAMTFVRTTLFGGRRALTSRRQSAVVWWSWIRHRQADWGPAPVGPHRLRRVGGFGVRLSHQSLTRNVRTCNLH